MICACVYVFVCVYTSYSLSLKTCIYVHESHRVKDKKLAAAASKTKACSSLARLVKRSSELVKSTRGRIIFGFVCFFCSEMV